MHLATSFIIYVVSSRMFYFQIFCNKFYLKNLYLTSNNFTADKVADHQKGNVSSILFHFRLSLWLLDLLSLNMFAKTLFILKFKYGNTMHGCKCYLVTYTKELQLSTQYIKVQNIMIKTWSFFFFFFYQNNNSILHDREE